MARNFQDHGPPDQPVEECECCGAGAGLCACPGCPVCGAAGDPACYRAHGLAYTPEQLRGQAEAITRTFSGLRPAGSVWPAADDDPF